jgi:hypothetical protein
MKEDIAHGTKVSNSQEKLVSNFGINPKLSMDKLNLKRRKK